MHFGLTEEQDLLQETLRRFTGEALPPNRLRELFNAGEGFDEDLWRGAAKLGLCGLVVPESLGGAGLELLDQALACEVLGESAAPGPFLGHALACLALVRGGSPAQQQSWLPRLASGDVLASVAFAEAGDRWSPEDWQIAPRQGRATGLKRFVEATSRTQLIIVGLEGGRLGLLESGSAGVRLEPVDRSDRTRPLADLQLDDAAIEPLPAGPEVARAILDAARILLSADAFGAAWRLIRMTADYARTREQFGTPIAQFQAVKHQLADMAMEAEPMRGLLWHAAYSFDHRPDELAREAATAKAHITDRAVQIGRGAVSLHGGIGFTWECDVHFWLKRTMFDRVWLGSPRAERERLARLAGW